MHEEPETPTTKTRILEVVQRIENRLEQFKDVPEEVKKLRELQKQLHATLSAKKADEDTFRDAAYRVITSAVSLLFPDKGNHKK